ncbi:hypothetical protein GCM10025868_19090 [Angustibacter aerolatus]|uniref:Uncharacterized protein n=1 Tax=Angustibacter aerolatus TaxID=1162965 RepID=A0ABQ6JHR8_9ACTN|nr:hypothetical protein GCM10025868_19090 [Angustibacter aerolatus]
MPRALVEQVRDLDGLAAVGRRGPVEVTGGLQALGGRGQGVRRAVDDHGDADPDEGRDQRGGTVGDGLQHPQGVRLATDAVEVDGGDTRLGQRLHALRTPRAGEARHPGRA